MQIEPLKYHRGKCRSLNENVESLSGQIKPVFQIIAREKLYRLSAWIGEEGVNELNNKLREGESCCRCGISSIILLIIRRKDKNTKDELTKWGKL